MIKLFSIAITIVVFIIMHDIIVHAIDALNNVANAMH